MAILPSVFSIINSQESSSEFSRVCAILRVARDSSANSFRWPRFSAVSWCVELYLANQPKFQEFSQEQVPQFKSLKSEGLVVGAMGEMPVDRIQIVCPDADEVIGPRQFSGKCEHVSPDRVHRRK